MTSSLVGSEMCIRDSLSTACSAGGCGLGLGCVASHASTDWRMCGCVPVSYTHLTLPTICSV
eukprot:12251249-Prorocentrum_lima.AAC.1